MALLLVGFAAYANSLHGAFVFDDNLTILENPNIRSLWPVTRAAWGPTETPIAGRPLVALSLAANYAVGGVEPFGYHLVNLALHLGCGLLLFGIVRRALASGSFGEALRAASIPLACASAAMWTLHPLNTEVVDYVSQRTESMMAVCFLLAFYASIRVFAGVPSGGFWTLVAIAACACGALCKESMVTAPLIVLVYDAAFSSGGFAAALNRRRGLYAGLFASWGIVAALLWTSPHPYSAGFGSGVSPWTYALNQTVMIARYLRLTIWPSPLVLDYGLPQPMSVSSAAPYLVLIAACMAATVILSRRHRPFAFLGLWFFITLAPASSIIPIATEVGAERRMYLPLASLVVLLVLGVWWMLRRLSGAVDRSASGAKTAVIATATLVIACAGLLTLTVRRNAEYQDAVGLWRTSVARFPTARAHAALATELVRAGRRDEGLAEYRVAAAEYPDADYGLGVELVRGGALDEGIEHLESFIRRRPMDVKVLFALNTIGHAHLDRHRTAEAAASFNRLLTLDAKNKDARLGLSDVHDAEGLDLVRADREREAVIEFRAAVGFNPNSEPAHENLGHALVGIGQPEQAVEQYRAALALQPANASLHGALGLALAMTRQTDESVASFERALQIDPRSAAVRESLEIAVEDFGLNALRDPDFRRLMAVPVD